MRSDADFSVVIIGGGFCGVLTMINLIEKSMGKTSITIINKGYPLARGVAYKTYSDKHLLNVEARNMSAFPDKPDHFVEWCLLQKDLEVSTEDLPFTYMPRNMYGRYIEEMFNNSVKNIPEHLSINILEDEAIDIDKLDQNYVVKTASGKKIIADKIVLATGNCEPCPPSIPNAAVLKSKNYFSNPWCEKAVLNLNDSDTTLIIGTGLTMVDVIIGLRENNFKGKIISLSPHGYNILPHRKLPPQQYILDELTPPYDLETLFKLFYRHIRAARKLGLPGETVVDAIRARTQEIWQQLSLSDKKKFMTHLRHLWGVARHRLPAHVHQEIQQMIKDENLRVIAGRIKNITENENGIEVKIQKRKDQSELILNVSRIINCTGPETDICKQKSPLFDSLIKKGFICSDNMNLGVDANANGQVRDKNQLFSKQIFAIGSLLKGMLWESTAIPELRLQAATVAELIVKDNASVRRNEKRSTFNV